MILIDDFFKILRTSKSENRFSISIELNPEHLVYTGHFPGYPVTPGVIQIQIVHELLEQQFARKLKLATMPRCKFLKVLNPNETKRIDVQIEFDQREELINVKAKGENESAIYFKFNSTYLYIDSF